MAAARTAGDSVGTVTVTGATVKLTPSAPLAFATTYTATITTGVTDVSGNAVAANFSWSFTTAGSPPAVVSTVPSPGANGVAVTANVSALFSEAVAVATVTDTTFTLGSGSSPVVGAVSSYLEKYLTTSVSQWVAHDLGGAGQAVGAAVSTGDGTPRVAATYMYPYQADVAQFRLAVEGIRSVVADAAMAGWFWY